MSKTARPARTRTTARTGAGKAAPKRSNPARPAKSAKSAKPAKSAVAKKRPAAKSAKRPATLPGRAARTTRTATTPPAEKKAATPRLPADVKLAVAAAQDKLAVDLTVLDLRNATAFTDFFIVCTGTNTKHVQAIADGIEASLRTAGQKPALVEGYRRGEWILLDYFTFIVHVFLPTRRSFYALERLWGGAEPIEVSAP